MIIDGPYYMEENGFCFPKRQTRAFWSCLIKFPVFENGAVLFSVARKIICYYRALASICKNNMLSTTVTLSLKKKKRRSYYGTNNPFLLIKKFILVLFERVLLILVKTSRKCLTGCPEGLLNIS